MENKTFDSNYDDLKMVIEIKVYKNVSILSVGSPEGVKIPFNYHEVVGCLETQKYGLMAEQRDRNLKMAKRKRKK